MRPRLWMLALTILPYCQAKGSQLSNECCKLPEDPMCHDPRLEVFYEFQDQWPTGIAMTPCGRKFACYPASIDPLNTNDGCNGKYAVAELTKCEELPYPNYCMNNPYGGVINYSTCPPTTKGLRHHFISVQTIVYIKELNLLFCLDAARARDCKQILYQSSSGGTKVVVIDLCNDCVAKMYYFDDSVAKPTSYFRDLAVDPKKNVAYIVDGSESTIVVLDLCTGKSYVAFKGDQTLFSNPDALPVFWGQPYYSLASSTLGNTTVGPIPLAVSTVSLSPDGKLLYYSPVFGRFLYSVCTESLLCNLPSTEVAKTVRSHGEKGVSFGILCDQRGRVWSGCAENNGITVFNPSCPFARNFLYIRDLRLGGLYLIIEPGDGYIYCVSNYMFGLPLVYPGTGPLFVDRRRKPYVVFRFKSPCESLCPSFCDPATLGLQVCSCGCCN
ncbi:unnamed protein product [Bemisia tabaci]|uniref:Uncharacterized protein n=1 Tax=Bemisia tabaci TaxID=7038 RepID=A0A9P0CBB4_BEMTA|nr:unnamed protein product [Bemisia tabaci]